MRPQRYAVAVSCGRMLPCRMGMSLPLHKSALCAMPARARRRRRPSTPATLSAPHEPPPRRQRCAQPRAPGQRWPGTTAPRSYTAAIKAVLGRASRNSAVIALRSNLRDGEGGGGAQGLLVDTLEPALVTDLQRSSQNTSCQQKLLFTWLYAAHKSNG